jgi:hypothetical protein
MHALTRFRLRDRNLGAVSPPLSVTPAIMRA